MPSGSNYGQDKLNEKDQCESGPGFLMVGHNENGEVVINLDHDRTGHFVFTPWEARYLGRLLLHKADRAELETLQPVWRGE